MTQQDFNRKLENYREAVLASCFIGGFIDGSPKAATKARLREVNLRFELLDAFAEVREELEVQKALYEANVP